MSKILHVLLRRLSRRIKRTESHRTRCTGSVLFCSFTSERGWRWRNWGAARFGGHVAVGSVVNEGENSAQGRELKSDLAIHNHKGEGVPEEGAINIGSQFAIGRVNLQLIGLVAFRAGIGSNPIRKDEVIGGEVNGVGFANLQGSRVSNEGSDGLAIDIEIETF